MTRRLIVTADDLGLHRGMTDGAIKAHRHGIVTACSLVANGREFEHAVERLKENPSIEVGVHLTFVEERPLSDSLDPFPKSWRQFALRYAAGAIDLELLEAEARLQVEKVLATQLPVTHLNSHQHLHVLPRVLEMVVRLAEEFRISFVRVPLDRGGSRRQGAMRLLGGFARRARHELRTNTQAIGIADAGHLTSARLIGLLQEVDDTTELVTHPGIDDPSIASAYDWGYDWDEETAALCDPAVREAIRARGITLITPSQAETT